MRKKSLIRMLLVGTLASWAFGAAFSAEWQSGAGLEGPAVDRPCGVFKVERGGAHFEACEAAPIGTSERAGAPVFGAPGSAEIDVGADDPEVEMAPRE